MEVNKEHLQAAIEETVKRYPDSIGPLIFFTTALGLKEKDPLADREAMHWAYGVAASLQTKIPDKN